MKKTSEELVRLFKDLADQDVVFVSVIKDLDGPKINCYGSEAEILDLLLNAVIGISNLDDFLKVAIIQALDTTKSIILGAAPDHVKAVLEKINPAKPLGAGLLSEFTHSGKF